MELYKIILVDDEEEVRQAIANKIDWQSLGFELVAEASNGKEALELAEIYKPDVVMTDIKMPFMDGLTLAKKVQQLIPGVRIALFSGFDEFEYAKEAIKLEVVEYILKPIDSDELAQVFVRIKKALDREIAEKRNLEKLSRYYEESLPQMRQQLLFQILKGSMEQGRMSTKLEQYDLDLKADKYAVATVCYDEKALDQSKNLVVFSIQEIVEENLQGLRYHFVMSMEHFGILFLLDEKDEIRSVINRLDRVFIPAQKILSAHVSIGVGSVVHSIEDISKSYEEAVDALDYRVLMERGQSIYIGDIEPGSMDKYPENTALKDEVVRQIKIGDKESLERAVYELIEGLSGPTISMSQYQVIRLELSTEMLKICHAYELEMSGEDFAEILKDNDSNPFNSLAEMRSWLITHAEDIRQRIHRERRDSTRLLADQAKDYIGENYANSDLSADIVCGELNVSPAYFSTTFRKETGITFVSYLTSLRMEKALELLNTTDLKTYQIASKVGYSDANYFSYVFKKEHGIAPSRYRQGKVKQNGAETTYS